MKNIFLLIISAFVIISCENSHKEDIKSNDSVIIGSVKMPGTDVLTPLLVGETNNQQTWMDYIKAHNERDLNKIAEINASDWMGYTPDGYVVKGTKAQIEALDNWFQSTDPKWEVKWMIANAAKNKNGVIEQWLTTGNDYTDVDENGNEIFEYNVHDVQFIDGKIKRINVYKRAKERDLKEFSY
jgi:hypothetical protein